MIRIHIGEIQAVELGIGGRLIDIPTLCLVWHVSFLLAHMHGMPPSSPCLQHKLYEFTYSILNLLRNNANLTVQRFLFP